MHCLIESARRLIGRAAAAYMPLATAANPGGGGGIGLRERYVRVRPGPWRGVGRRRRRRHPGAAAAFITGRVGAGAPRHDGVTRLDSA
jgi:hypothetical protein